MHRFPNPGSTLSNLTRCFTFLFENISSDEKFGLFDMQELLVTNGLISSSGTAGAEALLKGANTNLAKDRSYNQCKMYAEIFRFLGWIHSVDAALEYSFTLLGEHIARFGTVQNELVSYCLLNTVFPNGGLKVNGAHNIRPFATILKTMRDLDGVLSRDEMIIGPLSMSDDQDPAEYKLMLQHLSGLRKNRKALDKAIDKLLSARNITRNTAGNYTRFPLGCLNQLAWALPQKVTFPYSQKTHTYVLQKAGEDALKEHIDGKVDLRFDQASKMQPHLLRNLAIYSFYSGLETSGLDIGAVDYDLKECEKIVLSEFGTNEVLFSPFQILESKTVNEAFGINTPTKKRVCVYAPEKKDSAEALTKLQKSKVINSLGSAPTNNELADKIRELSSDQTAIEIVKQLKAECAEYKKEEFYPFIGNVFACMGLTCDIPPHGVHSRRWDAILLDAHDSIPIEIKSPTEELYLSTKAIRQALENKIILQSRQTHDNQRETSTLAVGYELPNLRAESLGLIEDIKKVFDMNIVIADIETLLTISTSCILQNESVTFADLAKARGMLHA